MHDLRVRSAPDAHGARGRARRARALPRRRGAPCAARRHAGDGRAPRRRGAPRCWSRRSASITPTCARGSRRGASGSARLRARARAAWCSSGELDRGRALLEALLAFRVNPQPRPAACEVRAPRRGARAARGRPPRGARPDDAAGAASAAHRVQAPALHRRDVRRRACRATWRRSRSRAARFQGAPRRPARRGRRARVRPPRARASRRRRAPSCSRRSHASAVVRLAAYAAGARAWRRGRAARLRPSGPTSLRKISTR